MFGRWVPRTDGRSDTVRGLCCPDRITPDDVHVAEAFPERYPGRTPGGPAARSRSPDLRYLTVSYHGFDRALLRGELVGSAGQASAVVRVMRSRFVARLPIRQMRLVDVNRADDDASVAAAQPSLAVMSLAGAISPLAGYRTALWAGAAPPVSAVLLASLLPTAHGCRSANAVQQTNGDREASAFEPAPRASPDCRSSTEGSLRCDAELRGPTVGVRARIGWGRCSHAIPR